MYWALLAILLQPLAPQPEDLTGDMVDVTFCDLQLTDSGRTARFYLSWIYQLTTGPRGQVSELKPLRVPEQDFVVEEGIRDCLRRWLLPSRSVFRASVSGGTTAAEGQVSLYGQELRLVIRIPK